MPTKPCRDCGTPIPNIKQSSRCRPCQTARNKYLHHKYIRTRLGSPALYKKLKSGRLVPADFNCGLNRNGTFPTKIKSWMSFHYDTNSSPTDSDLAERDKILRTGQDEAEDWIRIQIYNWRNGIDEYEEPPTRIDIYKKWKYYRNL